MLSSRAGALLLVGLVCGIAWALPSRVLAQSDTPSWIDAARKDNAKPSPAAPQVPLPRRRPAAPRKTAPDSASAAEPEKKPAQQESAAVHTPERKPAAAQKPPAAPEPEQVAEKPPQKAAVAPSPERRPVESERIAAQPEPRKAEDKAAPEKSQARPPHIMTGPELKEKMSKAGVRPDLAKNPAPAAATAPVAAAPPVPESPAAHAKDTSRIPAPAAKPAAKDSGAPAKPPEKVAHTAPRPNRATPARQEGAETPLPARKPARTAMHSAAPVERKHDRKDDNKKKDENKPPLDGDKAAKCAELNKCREAFADCKAAYIKKAGRWDLEKEPCGDKYSACIRKSFKPGEMFFTRWFWPYQQCP